MLATNFRVAMHNTIRIAPSYDRPDLTNPPGNEWLIVERSGAAVEVYEDHLSGHRTTQSDVSLEAEAMRWEWGVR